MLACFAYLEELVDFYLAGSININSLDGSANLVIRLSLSNLLDDLDKVLLVNLAAPVNIEATIKCYKKSGKVKMPEFFGPVLLSFSHAH